MVYIFSTCGFILFFLSSCSDDSVSPKYKDLEICFPSEDIADLWIYRASDSSLVVADDFDRSYVKSLHYNQISAGNYYIKAEAGKKKTSKPTFYYDGGHKSIDINF